MPHMASTAPRMLTSFVWDTDWRSPITTDHMSGTGSSCETISQAKMEQARDKTEFWAPVESVLSSLGLSIEGACCGLVMRTKVERQSRWS